MTISYVNTFSFFLEHRQVQTVVFRQNSNTPRRTLINNYLQTFIDNLNLEIEAIKHIYLQIQ